MPSVAFLRNGGRVSRLKERHGGRSLQRA